MTARTAPAPDLAAVRGAFPALQRREGGTEVAYFDAPGGTQVPAVVADTVREYLLHHNANTHWAYPTSVETDAIIAGARAAAADLLGAAPDQVAFGANMSTLTFHAARGLARGWNEGDEIIVTDLDHHANIAPWEAVAQDRRLTLHRVPLDAELRELDVDAFARLLSPRTRLVALGAASNAIGTITDVARLAAMAHDAGALVYVDAVHYVPHRLADVTEFGCDALACSAYKFYGPHVGLLWMEPSLAARIDIPKLRPAPDQVPGRLETGTLNHEGISGVTAAVDFIAALAGEGGDRRQRLGQAFARLHQEGEALLAQMWEGLTAIDGVRLFGRGPGEPRTPTVAFTVGDGPSDDIAAALAARGVFVSSGDFYASTVVERLGLTEQGLVRAGAAAYTSAGEVDRLVDAVREVARR
ncbi:MAG TPA: cysteine desulfurase-like protein [Gemmatimonadales bacterium]|nr:cysteine desulfurase-like protein [Gemmatimonadales bacterium]